MSEAAEIYKKFIYMKMFSVLKPSTSTILLTYSHSGTNNGFIGFEVHTVVVIKSSIFLDAGMCSLFKINQYFEGICHLHIEA
jgi:hypothetical protein